IKTTLIKQNWIFSSVHSDETLRQYFPYRVLPHQVIIRDNIVVAISSGNELEKNVLADLLTGKQVELRVKKDAMDFDRSALLFRYPKLPLKESLVYGSSFFKHMHGLGNVIGLTTTS